METFTPEFVLYYGLVTYIDPVVTTADPNLLPTMTGQDQSMKSERTITVSRHPSSKQAEEEDDGGEMDYSTNDFADVRRLA